MKNKRDWIRLGSAVLLTVLITMTACGRVIDSGEEYVPISEISAAIDPVSYNFASIDQTAQATSMEALGEFFVQYNESTNIQRVYTTDAVGTTTMAAEFGPGEKYVMGPLSPDCTKLFLYKQTDTGDSDHYYGVILDMNTGLKTTSAMPMFALDTVSWAGNDLLFTANRQILFFSTVNFSVVTKYFEITSLVTNDPDGKYVITGMAYDRNSDKYVAAIAEKIAGATELNELYKTKLMIAVIDNLGRTEKTFYVADGYYSPVDISTGAPLSQTVQVDSSGNAAVYAGLFTPGSDEPSTCWIVVNTATNETISLPLTLRTGIIRGGWIYGISMDPYSAWWTSMSVNLYTPDTLGKYSLKTTILTQPSENRYIPITGTTANNTYELFLYPDGNLLMKAYHTESGYSRMILYRITVSADVPTVEVIGALPAKSSMKYMIAGVDMSGKIIYLSDY
ncbi:MAG TPA: hypothetical protein PK629_11015 [Oscillospiraceae bacterium]|nr:hypothetical protein [Oscillospiraceae bacterium]HPF55994.1 hypothetical protein [Clostridiales bacterium]HPK36212.1 hypothetical protein [Oscillospiraceae bacterium]HPR75703.1 hypothetical protein [Oscillospiraceae bacterium]